MTQRKATTYGFKRTSALLQKRIRTASQTRGFAQSRLLTQWPEIVGDDIAAIARPVKISYAKHGLGTTLTVLTTGAQAPMLEMQKEKLRQKVNTVYGYNAISRITITQTAPTGFSEGQANFEHHAKPAAPKAPDPESIAKAEALAAPVGDMSLRAALEILGQNIISKSKRSTVRK
ncbi:Zn-ribbon-containing, possibly RNA-binding protein and truncated derivatives [hydrothermal vent metagenome]|uniref:Zn-ribbon-containing, possibly RNA-binding protein and truncated derivatives n=1 Tax=hydrothermal vent metagenome TaxID=652676 RepID=A0A3B0RJC2_9ZZZZ